MKDILEKVLEKMEVVETFTKLTGEEKKMRVMSSLKCFMTDKEVEKYGDIISGFIDLICFLGRNSKSINLNNATKSFSWCCH